MRAGRALTLGAAVGALALALWAAAQPAPWKVAASYQTSLAGRTSAQAHNAALAAQAIDGKVVPAGGEFSFNRVVGSWTADRGYVKAPVSYDGEMIPSWGGGVCQTSTTLYNAALLAGMQIVERHRHQFPARYAPPGQDAAVAQYDIDLRFRNPYDWPVRIAADAAGDRLTCSILSAGPVERGICIEREIGRLTAPGEVVRMGRDRPNRTSRLRVINHGAPGMRVAVYRRTGIGPRSARELISIDTYPPMNRLVVVE